MKLKVLFLFLACSLLRAHSIAVCIPAVDAREESVQALVESGRRHFCRLHEVRYFILSEMPPELEAEDVDWLSSGVTRPFKIFHVLQSNKEILEEFDYVFVIDPKLLFVAPVGDEVLGDLIAVQSVHSTVKRSVYSPYFFGGRPKSLTGISKEAMQIEEIFVEKKPTRILTPSYAYPENWKLEYSKKIIITERAT